MLAARSLKRLGQQQLIKEVSAALPVLLCILFFLPSLHAALKIPNGLDHSERQEFIKQIGFASSYKYLAQGYILGGYQGLEVAATVENIPFSKTNYLSQTTIDESDRPLQSFSVGKGLYQNVDIFFTFSPFLFQNQISSYGGAIRYIFYEHETKPLNVGFLLHGNGLNISNLVGIQTSGVDIVTNYYSHYWTMFFGFGLARSIGSFVGGANGVTEDQNTADEDIFQNRYYAGFSYDFGSYALSFQVDRVYSETFSAKLGTRF